MWQNPGAVGIAHRNNAVGNTVLSIGHQYGDVDRAMPYPMGFCPFRACVVWSLLLRHECGKTPDRWATPIEIMRVGNVVSSIGR
jgi:hypothetical protein